MRRFSKRSTVIAAASAITLLVAGGVAFAFWTAGGGGTGAATTGTTEDLEVVQTSDVTLMAPGIAPQTLTGEFNNDNDGPAYVSDVTASIGTVTKALDAPTGACTAADYVLTDAVMTVDAEIPAGDAQGDWTGAQIAFDNDPAVNQDGCKGASVELVYVVS